MNCLLLKGEHQIMTTQKLTNRLIMVLLSAILLMSALPLQALALAPVMEVKAKAQLLVNEFDDTKDSNSISVKQIAKDLSLLDKTNWDYTGMSVHEIRDDGTVAYQQQILEDEDVTTYLNVREGNDGSIYMNFAEGELENTVQFTPENEIYVDGNKVSFSMNGESVNSKSVEPKAGPFRRYQETVPTGTKVSEYNGSGVTVMSTGIVDFGVEFAVLSAGAIVSILSAGLNKYLAATIGFLTGWHYNRIADWLKAKVPNYHYASFKEIKYSRSKDNVVYHYKHTTWVYSERYYEGDQTELNTFYEIVEPT